MKRLRKASLTGVMALTLLAGLAGCSRQTAATTSSNGTGTKTTANHSNEVYYWVSQNSTLPLFVQNDYKGLALAAKQLGVTVKKAGPTNINLPGFISTIEQVCAMHPAGVTVVGWDPSETAAVNQCIAEGVPTVTDDADLPDSKRLAFIGTNWYNIGAAQAKAMLQATGGHGQVAVLSIINADNMKQAVQGFKDTLKGTGLQIVASEDDGGDASKAAQQTASLLAAYPHLAGIAGMDSESGAGIVQALKEANKVGQVKVTAMEQTPAFFKTVQDGSVSAIIVQKRELFTYYAIKFLYDYNHNGLTVDGLKPPIASTIPQNIDTGLLVVTKDNVNQLLAADKSNS